MIKYDRLQTSSELVPIASSKMKSGCRNDPDINIRPDGEIISVSGIWPHIRSMQSDARYFAFEPCAQGFCSYTGLSILRCEVFSYYFKTKY